MLDEVSKVIAGDILKAIQASKKILLHCHVSPDGDSIGSTLAMYFVLKNMGKEVTAIWGDTGPVQQFSFLPGFGEIISKNYFEIDQNEFDLFIIQDSASIDRISMKGNIIFPETLKTVVIDHHVSNTKFATTNLVSSGYPSTAAILFDLFTLWNISITKEMAIAMMTGTYTDTGGFRFRGVNPHTFETMSKLVTIEPRYPEFIEMLDRDIEYGRIKYLGLAYNSIEFFFNGKAAMTSVSKQMLQDSGIEERHTQKQPTPNVIKSIKGVVIGIEMVEWQPNEVKFSFRTNDAEKYDVSKLATSLGGGGHKSASGLMLLMPIEEAKKKVLDKIAEIFPDLN